MAMTKGDSGGTLKIGVEIEAQNRASTPLQGVAENLDDVRDSAAGVSQGFVAVSSGAKQMAAGVEVSAGRTTYLMQNIGRVISDMPYGIQGIGNNIQPLAESFRMVANEAGGSRAAIQTIISSLGGPVGLLMVGLPVVTSLAIAFGDKLVSALSTSKSSVVSLEKSLEGLQKYQEFSLAVKISGLDGIEKLKSELMQLQRADAFIREKQRLDLAAGDVLHGSRPAFVSIQGAEAERRRKETVLAEQREFYRQSVSQIKAGELNLGQSENIRWMTTWGGLDTKGATLLSAQHERTWAIANKQSQIGLAQDKADEAARKKNEAAGKREESEAARAEKRYQTVLSSLEAERIKLTSTAEDYTAYQEIIKAGVQLDSKQAAAIRQKVAANEALKRSQAEVHAVSTAMLDIDERWRKLGMSATDYEVYSALKKAGVDRESASGRQLESSLREVQKAEHSLGKSIHDTFAGWLDGMDASLNRFVWDSKAGFADIAKAFGQMVSQMVIKWAVIKPLESAIGIKFANGGIMTDQGPMELRRYANGGVATSPQLAMFGEGRTPEAFVPLPDGRSIPVDWRGGSQMSAPVNVQLQVINQSGQAVSARTESRFDGKDYIITTVLEAVSNNYNGSGEALAGIVNKFNR